MVEKFLNLLKRDKNAYIIASSLIVIVLIINSVIDFTDKLIKNPTLLLFSLAVFYFFMKISIREEIWKNEK